MLPTYYEDNGVMIIPPIKTNRPVITAWVFGKCKDGECVNFNLHGLTEYEFKALKFVWEAKGASVLAVRF